MCQKYRNADDAGGVDKRQIFFVLFPRKSVQSAGFIII